jgi:hypothetical protein
VATGAEFCFGMNSGARGAPTVQSEGACRSPNHLCRRASARRWWFRGGRARGRLAAWLPEWTIFDSDVERLGETPAFLGEQKYDLAGACSDSANPR